MFSFLWHPHREASHFHYRLTSQAAAFNAILTSSIQRALWNDWKKNVWSPNISSLMNGKWHLFCWIIIKSTEFLKIYRGKSFVSWSFSLWKFFLMLFFLNFTSDRFINYSVKWWWFELCVIVTTPSRKQSKYLTFFKSRNCFL